MIRTHHRAALYARFSSDNQRSESIDAQVRAMTAYCKQKNIIIVDTYIDEAKSATTDRRPAFQQMIADSTKRNFDILLVHKLDRFARNRYDSAVYKRELKKNGVMVYSVLENLDDSPESIMMEAVLEGMSEYYSQNLAREVMKGLKETALQGKHTGGKPPLGYDIDPLTHKLTVNSQEADIVRTIFRMYADGHGYSAILDTLHSSGSKTKNGNEFMKNSLYSILTNPKYQGIYVFNRSSAKGVDGTRNTHLLKENEDIITIDGGCPQIVDAETFSKVQARISKNKHTGGRSNAKTNYLLSGKVFCKECGRAMVGNTRYSGRDKRLYVTYRCPSKRYACSNKEINQVYLEQYIIGILEQYIFSPTAAKALSKKLTQATTFHAKETAKEIALLREEQAGVASAIQNITEAIMDGLCSQALTIKLSELERQLSAIGNTLSQLQSNQETINTPIDTTLIPQEYAKVKETPANPSYKHFIQGFIDRIDIGRYNVSATIKTGLDLIPTLDTTLSVRRQEVYDVKKVG